MTLPVIQFGASDGFGTITGLELKSDTPNTQTDRARGLDSKGNEVAHYFHNTRTEYTSVYTIVSDTNDISTLVLGKLLNGRIVTRIAIDTDNGEEANTITIGGHQHAVNAHTDTLQQQAISGFLPESGVPAFGAVDFLGGTAGSNASAVRGSITFECQHNDKTGTAGNHLVGENYDGMITAQTTWEGVPTVAVNATGWVQVTSVENPVSNTDFKTTQTSATQPMLLATPA